MPTLSELVKACRYEHRLTQAQLAREMGVSRSAVSQIENGLVLVPTAGHLLAIARACRVDHGDVLKAAGVRSPGRPSDARALTAIEQQALSLARLARDDERDWLAQRLAELRELLLTLRKERPTRTSSSSR